MIVLTSWKAEREKAAALVPRLFTAAICGYHYPSGDAGGWLPELEVK